MKELVVTIQNRRYLNKQELVKLLQSLKDGKHLIRISAYSKRSLRQNAYYHGVVVPMVRQGLFDAGYMEVTEDEDAHEIIKRLFLKKKYASDTNGDEVVITGSTRKLTTIEFNQFLAEVIQWAAAYLSIVIPDPNSAYAMLSDYAEEIEHEA